ncbi:MAG TPA: glutaredoxin family protein [Mycetocola sp.]|uniref:glutaredoxin family protein n=1 Tax=Mycetocola sp. TaxID=1871042 RepID=UPI002638B9BA|nr:glutaredoxin family protein [Mycetocola sp.]MCU1560166.1 thioredoxin family protein [Mycetocola sp.]HEV7849450.1 glutaredoxin family protein [Mycetocola sp.]
METASLTLIGRPGCHLCDDARTVVTRVMDELSSRPDAPALTLDEVSILDDAELNAKYAEEIPVLLINGRVHNYWRIDPVRLTNALLELT